MIVCLNGGELVGATEWLPSAPFDFRWPGPPRPRRGCNHVRCARCTAVVRQQPGLTMAADLDAGKVFLAPDFAVVSGIEPSPTGRLYACMCHLHVEHAYIDLRPPAGEDVRSPMLLDWECAGHPPLPVPTTLDGEEISETADVGDLVERRMAAPEDALPDDLRAVDVSAPAFWTLRLYRLLEAAGTTLAANVAVAVADRLDHTDAQVRLGSLTFFNMAPDAPGAERLIEPSVMTAAVGTAPFAGKPWDLRLQLQSLLMDIVRTMPTEDQTEAALSALRSQATDRATVDRYLIRFLGEFDEQWLYGNAGAIAAAAPGEAKTVIEQLGYADAERLPDIIEAIAAAPGVHREEVVAAAESTLDEGSLSSVLRRLGA